ncbi:NAD-dependent epimerase/dehydratase family protein [Janthinobacterium aquaticum]|uniref:NAD-dependent epimerase/dehydratase family protein n=1 Tax=Janthinobacterium sp. FT58W TaxID=2654254 RepID=UPI001264F305|nr:NAD-dependent epimerase/dehydratase family protein [Janthinobacterium sp. FT58W]KAB8041563.1 NAD-dependent epimerase/dehydratase family protein [Janthinobacterium sp. FT58W]
MSEHSAYALACRQLQQAPRRWLVTGAAGFIGSHLLETLLLLGQQVRGLDNFSTGKQSNLALVRAAVGEAAWRRCEFHEADIRDAQACARACEGVGIVLHQAALGSVPRSLAEPQLCHDVNVTGFVQMLGAARAAGVARLVYAASSAVYGDHPGLPKVEEQIGAPLSPYALSKYVNELTAAVYGRCFGVETIGLRYFNVFGPRQDPHGDYAAVIPRWLAAMLDGRPVTIHGDGATSRDFCYVSNAVQANLLAATTGNTEALGRICNVALNARTTLLELHAQLQDLLAGACPQLPRLPPLHGASRAGDVRHSQADIGKAVRWLGFAPSHDLHRGLRETVAWHLQQASIPAVHCKGAHIDADQYRLR